MRTIEEALQVAERSVVDFALGLVRLTMAVALVHSDSSTNRDRGLELLGQVGEMILQQRFYATILPVVDLYTARARAQAGDLDSAVDTLPNVLDQLFDREQLSWTVPGTAILVEALLDRGGGADVAEAAAAVDRLVAAPADEGIVVRDIMVVRLRALLARARGDEVEYRDLRDRYREMANALGFEGHIAWAAAMP
jgi:hypothetical protein